MNKKDLHDNCHAGLAGHGNVGGLPGMIFIP
jgi:hypothetical protein